MSKERRVIRFEPLGPAETGLPAMTLDQADFQSSLPDQHLHVYFDDEEIGLNAGVWTTTDMQEAFGPYPGDEFMVVLEGKVAMIDADGRATHIRTGESFCIRNAIPVSWKQEGFLRKFYLALEDPNAEKPEIASAEGGVVVLDAGAFRDPGRRVEGTDPFVIEGDQPVQHDSLAFTNDAGTMFVGRWQSTAFESEMAPFPRHELVQLLEGTINIEEADGTMHVFTAGDVFMVPKDTVCRWKTTGFVRKLYCVVTAE